MKTFNFNNKIDYDNFLQNKNKSISLIEAKIETTDSISEKSKFEKDLKELEKQKAFYYNITWDLVNLSGKDLIKKALTKKYIRDLIEVLDFENLDLGDYAYIGCDGKRPFGSSSSDCGIPSIVFDSINKYKFTEYNAKYDGDDEDMIYKCENNPQLFMTYDDVEFIVELIPKLINDVIKIGLEELTF
tara:strand:+ start:1859 stop:2419 length:561 start_codon:yes stop_codon:yes gene_type:complete